MTCFRRDGAYCSAATAPGVFNEDDWLASTGKAGHLFDSLTYLLQAAQEWQAQDELMLDATGYQVQVYAMDSVFLRARSLFEFFTDTGRNYCHARCLFNLPSQLAAPANFTDWKNELHIGAMHLQARHTGGQLVEYGGTNPKDLNKMPVDIAYGVLEVWDNFERALAAQGHTNLHNKAVACRKQAKQDANLVIGCIRDRSKAYDDKAPTFGTLTKLF